MRILGHFRKPLSSSYIVLVQLFNTTPLPCRLTFRYILLLQQYSAQFNWLETHVYSLLFQENNRQNDQHCMKITPRLVQKFQIICSQPKMTLANA